MKKINLAKNIVLFWIVLNLFVLPLASVYGIDVGDISVSNAVLKEDSVRNSVFGKVSRIVQGGDYYNSNNQKEQKTVVYSGREESQVKSEIVNKELKTTSSRSTTFVFYTLLAFVLGLSVFFFDKNKTLLIIFYFALFIIISSGVSAELGDMYSCWWHSGDRYTVCGYSIESPGGGYDNEGTLHCIGGRGACRQPHHEICPVNISTFSHEQDMRCRCMNPEDDEWYLFRPDDGGYCVDEYFHRDPVHCQRENDCSDGKICVNGNCVEECAENNDACGTGCSTGNYAWDAGTTTCKDPANNACIERIARAYFQNHDDCRRENLIGDTSDCDCDANCREGVSCAEGDPFADGTCILKLVNSLECCADQECISNNCAVNHDDEEEPNRCCSAGGCYIDGECQTGVAEIAGNNNCNDGLDNDCDGGSDRDDPGCGVCGNNNLEELEECEGANLLRGYTCANISEFGHGYRAYHGGTLGCSGQCTFNVSRCYRLNDGVCNGPDEDALNSIGDCLEGWEIHGRAPDDLRLAERIEETEDSVDSAPYALRIQIDTYKEYWSGIRSIEKPLKPNTTYLYSTMIYVPEELPDGNPNDFSEGTWHIAVQVYNDTLGVGRHQGTRHYRWVGGDRGIDNSIRKNSWEKKWIKFHTDDDAILGLVTINAIQDDRATGLIYVDSVNLIELDRDVDYSPEDTEHGVPFIPSEHSYGCCYEGECWDGTECVTPEDLQQEGNENPVPVCRGDVEPDAPNASWYLPYRKEHWKGDLDYEHFIGYCPYEDSCWEGESQSCFEVGEFVNDHLCTDVPQPTRDEDEPPPVDWSSQTLRVAANILELSDNLFGEDANYTLVCDSGDCYEFACGRQNDAQCERFCSNYAITCVYKSGDTIIAGTSLDRSIPNPRPNECNPYDEGPGQDIRDPDLNPECFFDIILNVDYNNLPQGIVMDFSYSDNFENANLTQDQTYNHWGPDYNTHPIQSVGWNNNSTILLFSNQVIDYHRILGEGVTGEDIWDRLPNLKDYYETPGPFPQNLETGDENDSHLSTMILNETRKFNTLLISNNNGKHVESIVEGWNNPWMYFAIFYDNIHPDDTICHETEERVVDYRGTLNCSTSDDHSNYDIFFRYPSDDVLGIFMADNSDPPTNFIRNTWDDTTSNFRTISLCAYTPGYKESWVPDTVYEDVLGREFLVYNNPLTQGCCLNEQCWNGLECVDHDDNMTYDDQLFLCDEGNWTHALSQKWDWDHNQSSYCFEDWQCYMPWSLYEAEEGDGGEHNAVTDERNCTNMTNHYFKDHLCLTDPENTASTWTSRTALIAAQLLDFTFERGFGDEFSLFCDVAGNTLLFEGLAQNVIDYVSADSVNNFCVLRYADEDAEKVAFGVSFNNDTNVSTFIATVINQSLADECNDAGSEVYENCDDNNTMWYNNITKSFIYNKDGMQLTELNWWEAFLDFLSNPIGSIIEWIRGWVGQETPPEMPEDFSRIYHAVIGSIAMDREIKGVVKNKANEDYVLVTYINITAGFDEAFENLDYNVSGDSAAVYISPININLWPDFASKLRLRTWHCERGTECELGACSNGVCQACEDAPHLADCSTSSIPYTDTGLVCCGSRCMRYDPQVCGDRGEE